jgi:adenylate cyclase
LHYGEVCIGDVGAGKHYEYRAIGDTVNTVTRIEGANKAFGTRLLASEEILSGIGEFEVRELGLFRLLGKSKGLRLLELQGTLQSESDGDPRLTRDFSNGLSLFQQQCWEEAFQAFSRLQQAFPDDGPISYYAHLCDQYRRQPPAPDWDGAVELVVK